MWIVCNTNKPYDKQHFLDAAIRLNIDLKIIDPTKLQILNDNEITFYYQGTKLSAPDYMLNWNGCMNGKLEEQIESALTACGTIICNSLSEINHWQDKFRWQLETDLPVATSLKIHSSYLLNSIDLIEANFDYPLIIKSDTGSLGMGVYKATDRNNLQQIIEIITLLDTTFKVHIEQFIDYTNDVRMYIIGNQYYLMERIATDDFRANVAQHAKVEKLEQNQLFDSIFNQIRTNYQSLVIGVDILLTASSCVICEINSAPGFAGLETVHNIDVASEIIQAIYE